jgi:hypothetical protein
MVALISHSPRHIFYVVAVSYALTARLLKARSDRIIAIKKSFTIKGLFFLCFVCFIWAISIPQDRQIEILYDFVCFLIFTVILGVLLPPLTRKIVR